MYHPITLTPTAERILRYMRRRADSSGYLEFQGTKIAKALGITDVGFAFFWKRLKHTPIVHKHGKVSGAGGRGKGSTTWVRLNHHCEYEVHQHGLVSCSGYGSEKTRARIVAIEKATAGRDEDFKFRAKQLGITTGYYYNTRSYAILLGELKPTNRTACGGYRANFE